MTSPASPRRYLALWLPTLAEDNWRRGEILPGTGRRTARVASGGGGERLDVARGESPLHQPAAGSPPHPGEELTVFTEREGNAIRITALSRAAAALGFTPGTTLADARARVPELVAIERDRAAEIALRDRVLAACARYTPMASATHPDGIALDITGCTHLFGGKDALAADFAARLATAGITARYGYGTTPEAARARARFGTAVQSQLRQLPVAALEATPEVETALRRAGLRTIGDLAHRPRRMLAARFGDLALRLARLLEEEDRRITPRRVAPPVAALRRFHEPIGRVEDALACLEELAGEAAVTLAERHRGGRRFEARFFRTDGMVVALAIETGRPTRDPALVIRLVRDRVETLSDPIDPGFGFDLVRLDVAETEPLAAHQDALTGESAVQEQVAELVDRLSARLGPGRVRRVEPRNTHIPECAVGPVAPAAASAWPEPEPEEPPLRPLRLFDPPQPVEVLYLLPDGPPNWFVWARRRHDVARWEGPERIGAEWWRRRDRGGLTRDYYRVEDGEGRRFWLFRHGLQGREAQAPAWYLHGLYA